MRSAGRSNKKKEAVSNGTKQPKAPQRQVKKRMDQAEIVERLLGAIAGRIEKDQLKASLGDFIRLLQLQKELDIEEPKEIEVRWVEAREPESVNG